MTTVYAAGTSSVDGVCWVIWRDRCCRSQSPIIYLKSIGRSLMHNYADLKLFMDRWEAAKAEKLDASMNASRHPKHITEGTHVFRKKPAFARPHKGTFPEKSSGPYVVVRKLGEAHVILQDPETGIRSTMECPCRWIRSSSFLPGSRAHILKGGGGR